MKLRFDSIGKGSFNVSAYTSNLSALSGEVPGGEDINTPDIYSKLTTWMYQYERDSGTLYIWKVGDESNKHIVFSGVMFITELSFTFNKRMDFFCIYKKRDATFLYSYDPLTAGYLERQIENLNQPRVALTSLHPDHKNEAQVVIGYINNNNELCIRREQDRFSVERVIKSFPKKVKLFNIGYNELNRFQYEVLEAV